MLDREQDKAINESMKEFPGYSDEYKAEAIVRANANTLLDSIQQKDPQSIDDFKSYARGEVLRWGKSDPEVTPIIQKIMYELLLRHAEIEQPAVQ